MFLCAEIISFNIVCIVQSQRISTLPSDGVEEGDAKAEDGASGGIPIDLAEMSSDEDAEKCPICLNSFSSQPVATPESCEHYFCLDCILAWAKVGPT